MKPIRQPYLAPLTSVRFFAALGVVLFHVEAQFLGGLPYALHQIVDRGYVGVGLFFVLSGFILVYTYVGPAPNGRIDAGAFWAARFARIYPVYLLSFCLAAPIFFSSLFGLDPAPLATEKIAFAVALMPTMTEVWTLLTAMLWHVPDWSFATPTLDWNFPAWSLCAEAFFYALFPLLVPRLVRMSSRALAALLPFAWLLAIAGPLVYQFTPGATYPSDHAIAAWSWVINYTPIFRLPEFIFGAILGLLYLRHGSVLRFRHDQQLNSGLAALAIVALLGSFVLIRDMPGLLLANGLFDPLFGILIYSLAVGGVGLTWLLSRPPLILLGEASYALYLLHVPLWDVLAKAAAETHHEGYLDQGWYFWVYLGAAISVSVIVHLAIERPARHAIRRLLTGATRPHRTAPVSVSAT